MGRSKIFAVIQAINLTVPVKNLVCHSQEFSSASWVSRELAQGCAIKLEPSDLPDLETRDWEASCGKNRSVHPFPATDLKKYY